MNNLARLNYMKVDIAGVSTSIVTNDALYLRGLAAKSRDFETVARRAFWWQIDTRYFEANAADPRKLWVGDLLTPGTVKVDLDDDGVYEVTLVQGTDYYLGPARPETGWPYSHLYLMGRGTQIYSWPCAKRSIELGACVFGFSNETEAIVSAGTAVTGSLSNASDLTLTASEDVSALIFPGDTLVVESEQLDVTAVTTTTVTVTRAINGTTAVTHSSAPLAVRRFPREVENAVAMLVVAERWDGQNGYDGATGGADKSKAFANFMRVAKQYRAEMLVA